MRVSDAEPVHQRHLCIRGKSNGWCRDHSAAFDENLIMSYLYAPHYSRSRAMLSGAVMHSSLLQWTKLCEKRQVLEVSKDDDGVDGIESEKTSA